jgi:hypothetical protein
LCLGRILRVHFASVIPLGVQCNDFRNRMTTEYVFSPTENVISRKEWLPSLGSLQDWLPCPVFLSFPRFIIIFRPGTTRHHSLSSNFHRIDCRREYVMRIKPVLCCRLAVLKRRDARIWIQEYYTKLNRQYSSHCIYLIY